MAIQPKNTTDINVDKISEKTLGSGITLANTTKVDALSENTSSAGITLNHTAKVDTIRGKTTAGTMTIASLAYLAGLPQYSFTTWSPTYGGSGSLAFTSVTGTTKYLLLGKALWVIIDVTGTTGGVTSTDLTITAPVTLATNGGAYQSGGGCVVTDTALISGTWRGSSVINIRRYDSGNWGLGAGRRLQISALLEAA